MTESIDLWIEQPVPGEPDIERLLHTYQRCPVGVVPEFTVAIKGMVRESECSGNYAVDPGPARHVLGSICGWCWDYWKAGVR